MAKEGIPIIDRDYKVIGHYPYDYPREWAGGKRPPDIIRIKGKPTKAGKNKNPLDRLFTFDGESATGTYSEARIEDFTL